MHIGLLKWLGKPTKGPSYYSCKGAVFSTKESTTELGISYAERIAAEVRSKSETAFIYGLKEDLNAHRTFTFQFSRQDQP